MSFFDVCVVDARKPKFFIDQAQLNYVNTRTG